MNKLIAVVGMSGSGKNIATEDGKRFILEELLIS